MKIGLFIPCYINAVYPEVGVASYKLLKSLGLDVDYPLDQTCCGQPRTVPFVRLCGWPFCQLCRFRERESSRYSGKGRSCVYEQQEDL